MTIQIRVRTFAICCIALAFGGSAVGQLTIVSPAALENLEGNQLSDTPAVPFRIQWLYPASDFDRIPPGGAFISGHAIRADGSEADFGVNTFENTTFTLSTAQVSSLTTSLDDNIGNDAKIVFQGTTAIGYPVDGPVGGPNPFGSDVEYDRWFFYDPATMGNLLLEQIAPSVSDTPGLSKDWGNTGTPSMAFTLDPVSDIADGLRSRVIVTRFTIVPEPSTIILCILAIVGLYSWSRRHHGARVRRSP